MEDMWDTDRLQTLAAIMPRYAPYVRPGDMLTLGVEGDPCNVYGRNECVQVKEVWKTNGDIHFRAARDGHEDMILDTTSLNPKRTWEVHRDYLDAISYRAAEAREADTTDNDSTTSTVVFRASVETRLADIDKTLQSLKDAFKGTTEHMRLFAEDIKRGRDTFANTYASTYDRVEAEQAESEPNVPYHGEKTNFEVEDEGVSPNETEKTMFDVSHDETLPRERYSSVQLASSEVSKAYTPFREIPP